MKFNLYWIILFLIIFLPSEDFILKWLPVSEKIYSLSRYISELLIYSLLIFVIFNRLFKGLPLRKTPIDFALFFFILVGLISIIKNHAPVFGGLIGIRTLLRYVAVYYIIVNWNMPSVYVRKLIFFIVFIGVFESLIGLLQHFVGISSFWLPRATDLEISGYTKTFTVLEGGIEKGASIGTCGQSVNMVLYLLISIVLLVSLIYGTFRLSKHKKFLLFIGLIVIFLGIVFTYSRGAILATILVFPITLLFMNKKKKIMKFLAMSSVVIAILFGFSMIMNSEIGTEYKLVREEYVNPIDNIRMIFSSKYVEKTEGSRLWVLKEIGGTILKSFTLIGYSPDEFTAREKIVKVSKGTLTRLIRYKAFEDVYWVAIIAYFGIIGTSLFIWILYTLYNCSKFVLNTTQDYTFFIIAVSMATLIVITFPLTLLVRTFEFRTFGFHFWLLAGLTMYEYLRLKAQTKLKAQSLKDQILLPAEIR